GSTSRARRDPGGRGRPPAGAGRDHRAASGDPGAQRPHAGGPHQRRLHGDAGPDVGVPGLRRPSDGLRRRAAAVRRRDRRAGCHATGAAGARARRDRPAALGRPSRVPARRGRPASRPAGL
ncbi:MAG: Chorismate mutase II, partial [uncultured Frankineae bacterium]